MRGVLQQARLPLLPSTRAPAICFMCACQASTKGSRACILYSRQAASSSSSNYQASTRQAACAQHCVARTAALLLTPYLQYLLWCFCAAAPAPLDAPGHAAACAAAACHAMPCPVQHALLVQLHCSAAASAPHVPWQVTPCCCWMPWDALPGAACLACFCAAASAPHVPRQAASCCY
jgi:hypothetical protein